jgi:hypothetical protein
VLPRPAIVPYCKQLINKNHLRLDGFGVETKKRLQADGSVLISLGKWRTSDSPCRRAVITRTAIFK